MKRIVLTTAALLALAAPPLLAADHGGHAPVAGVAHEEVVNGVRASFSVQTMADAMKQMGMRMPAGVRETHHISVVFRDARTGKPLTEGTVKVKVQGPDRKEQTRDLMGMHGHFGADFHMARKGKYGVMCKFQLKDGTVRSARFWYTVP